jgi:hypothetical protein
LASWRRLLRGPCLTHAFLDDTDLAADRRRCWRQLDEFNATAADDDRRIQTLTALFGNVGAGSVVLPRFQCSYGTQISPGRNVFVNNDATFMTTRQSPSAMMSGSGPEHSCSPHFTRWKITSDDAKGGSVRSPSRSTATPGSAASLFVPE